jgi:hypothetical protein
MLLAMLSAPSCAVHHRKEPFAVKPNRDDKAAWRGQLAGGLIAACAAGVTPAVWASPYTYQVSMDAVDNLANWATIDNGIGDLYDDASVKQVDVTYSLLANFGNAAALGTDPQFWNSLEYGNRHRAIFGPSGGTDVLQIKIAGLNGNTIDLSQVVMGRWFPDPINTLGSDWRVYDGSWNLLASGDNLMSDFVDYPVSFNFGSLSTVYFQFGDDNWDNGVISFSYITDVRGSLDMRLDRDDSPTVPAPSPNPVPAPSSLLLALAAVGLMGAVRRSKAAGLRR